MGSLLHHLAALGWGWVAVFLALDTVAIGSAVVAAAGRDGRWALWALLVCACAALASLAATTAVATAGLSIADAATSTGSDSSEQARNLAQGISVAMNGAALGLLSTLLTGLAAAVCPVAAVLHRSKSRANRTAEPNRR
jgi:hypothetical protein